jgi:AraC-like DNA-binding protein
MESPKLDFKPITPDQALYDFVYAYSSLQQLAGFKDGVIVPNGRIDLIFSQTTPDKLQIVLMGLETEPKPIPEQPVNGFFAISLNPLAVEYLLRQPVADLLNRGVYLPADFWGFHAADLVDFETFCSRATQLLTARLPVDTDSRKRSLFQLIFAANGEIAVQTLSKAIGWSERQINRYFNQQLGLSLKAYCSILRFQASLPHIRDGALYPQLNFTDQSHFIKEIKKHAGVSPKELFRNQNDRFLQFLAYGPK